MSEKLPFHLRLTCSVREACEATSWRPDKIYALINDGRLESRKVDKRRLILVRSVLALLDIEPTAPAPNAPKLLRSQQPAAISAA